MVKKNKKIGEILIENKLITQAMLDDALEHQRQHGGVLTQYLIDCGYIEGEDLARCISSQFQCPYLPLRAYEIPKDIIEVIPAHVAAKYGLIPVDKVENIITLVMANPLDEEAIREVENITNCKVQAFVGIFSEIIEAVEQYYNIIIKTVETKKAKKSLAPLSFVESETYSGPERRHSIRIKASLTIHFVCQDEYREAVTKNVSRHGFLFESPNILPLGSFIVLKVDLPKEYSSYPIVAVVQVSRVTELENKRFDIAVRLVSVPSGGINKIISYALVVNKSANKSNG